MPDAHWNPATLESRIADPHTRRRHPAGSPNSTEIAAYAAGLSPGSDCSGTALVLGMTPELRNLALSRFDRVFVADNNSHSIALYRDWVDPAARHRETTLEANWLSLSDVIGRRVDAILGDGVFGNLPDEPTHACLLEVIAKLLGPKGRLVTRMVMIPDGFTADHHRFERLLARFRAGTSDAAEFGFDTRVLGHYETCYDRRTSLLDNAKLFALCAARHQAGELTDYEHAAIRRYYYGGVNCIVSQRAWERLLAEGGWRSEIHWSRGKSWYAYYPVYACWR